MQLSYLWPVPCVFSSWVSSGRNVEVTVEVGILFFQPEFPQGSSGLGQLCKVGTWWLQHPVLTDMADSSSVHMTLRRMDILLLFEMVCIPCVLSHSVVCNSLWSCSPPDSSVHGDSPGKKAGVGCHVLLQRIFPTQVSHSAGGLLTIWAPREAYLYIFVFVLSCSVLSNVLQSHSL